MITFRPAHAFKVDGAPGDSDGREQERQKSYAEKTEHGNIAFHFDRIAYRRMLGIDFRFDAQIIMTGRDAREDDTIFLTALGPRAVAVVAVVVADFAAEVPGLLGVIIDQRVV